MKNIRLFFILVFSLSVNVPVAFSLVEPDGFIERSASKLLVQRRENSNLKIAHGKRRLRKNVFLGAGLDQNRDEKIQ